MYKVCSKCKKEKLLTDFYNSKNSWCKECNKEYRDKIKHREKIKIDSKICTNCHIEKPADNFYNSDYNSNGKCSWCIDCTNKCGKENREKERKIRESVPKKISRILSCEQLEEMCTLYNSGISMKELGKMFKINYLTVKSYLKKLGIRLRVSSEIHRHYKLNENFFDEIDTEEKAYFLGLLYADGCNIAHANVIKIALQVDDKYIVEKLRDLIFLEYRPLHCIREKIRKNGIHQKEMWELTITNKHMSNVLNNHGMMERKTFTVTFPKWLSKNLIPHFIRGYNDGDGCIENRNGNCRVETLGTQEFCESIKNIIHNKLEVKSSVTKRRSIYRFSICGINALKFLDWTYDNSTIYFKRKYIKYIELKEINNQKLLKKQCNVCHICGEKHYAKGLCQYHYYHEKGLKKKEEKSTARI